MTSVLRDSLRSGTSAASSKCPCAAMDALGDDLLWLILERLEGSAERKACAQVNSQWLRVEGLTRRTLKIGCPRLLPEFIHRFPNVYSVEMGYGARNDDLECIARHCRKVTVLNLSLPRPWPATGIESEDSEADDSELEYDVLTDRGLCAVAQGLRQLQTLQLRWRCKIGVAGFLSLAASCQSLTYLDLSFCKQINDGSLEAVSGIATLGTLRLTGCSGIGDKGLVALAIGRTRASLIQLELRHCYQLSDLSMMYLKNITCLTYLNVAECGRNITDAGLQTILSSVCLKFLDVSWLVNVTDATLMVAAERCPEISHLVLTGCNGVTDAGLAILGRCKNLQVLELSQCLGVTGSDFHEVALGCQGLRYLSLSYCLRSWISRDALDTLQARNCQLVWN